MNIVTHTSPDWDCIAGCWLLQRYGGMADAQVVFVNTGNPDRTVLDSADAVVDTGRELDPERGRFDHHHLLGEEQRACCAASLVFEWIQDGDWPDGLGQSLDALAYLQPLISLITAGDTGQREYGADWSRIIGLHALLSAQKARKLSDAALLAWGYEQLDLLAESLKQRHDARLMLDAHTVYRSADGLVLALKDAPQGATFAAFEAGARLTVFQSSYQLESGAITNAIGVMRGGEWQEPHCGTLVEELIADWRIVGDVEIELESWYRHPAGFFAGRGTQKAPDPRPVVVDLANVARAIDKAWKR